MDARSGRYLTVQMEKNLLSFKNMILRNICDGFYYDELVWHKRIQMPKSEKITQLYKCTTIAIMDREYENKWNKYCACSHRIST